MASQSGTAIYRTPIPFYKRVLLSTKLYFLKSLLSVVFHVVHLPGIRNRAIQPTFTKVYPIQPSLRHHIFVPKSYESGDAPLPLYLDLHGGGFSIGAPWFDDEFCHNFCNDNKVLAVSLQYPLAPQNRYLKAIHALVDVVNAVLNDESLPFDRTKVAMGGSSAGANLTLASTQDPGLRGKIGGIVAFYPPTDFTTPSQVALATRPKDAGPDMLEGVAAMFNYAYFTDDQDLRDPQLSVKYADRAKLPPKIYIVGCDYDLLCKNSEIMADTFGSVGNGKRTGTEDCWEQNGVKWERILEEPHGFDFVVGHGKVKIRRIQRREKLYADVAEFLFREVYT